MDPGNFSFERLSVLDFLRRKNHFGIVAERDKRDDIAGNQMIQHFHRPLPRLLDLGARHRAGAIQHNGQIQRQTFSFVLLVNGREVNFNHHLPWRAGQEAVVVGFKFEAQSFSGRRVCCQSRRQNRGKSEYFHGVKYIEVPVK
jgi:hypothetical protein